MTSDHYFTIMKPAKAEFKDRGSKFIAYAYPVKSVIEFKDRLFELKKEHPKATHHCFAYRIGIDKNIFRVGDDGEPSGTAGKPILGQIDSKQLTDILIVVVRYFGGTLLGVPGLINAYKTAAALALQVTPVVRKAIEDIFILNFDYTRMNEIMMIIKQLNCTLLEQETDLFCRMKISIPRNKNEEALNRMSNISNLEMVKA